MVLRCASAAPSPKGPSPRPPFVTAIVVGGGTTAVCSTLRAGKKSTAEMSRKLSSKFELNAAANGSGPSVVEAPNLAVNDDDAEKRRRRETRCEEKAILESPLKTPSRPSVGPMSGAAAPAASPPFIGAAQKHGIVPPARKDLTNPQLVDMYTQCIRLSSENKITTKNSFELNLIEYIDEVLKSTIGAPGEGNFQVASCTLDASVKIYSCRVDRVHNEAYRMLGTLTRSKQPNAKADEEGDDEAKKAEEKTGTSKAAAAAGARSLSLEATLEHNTAALDVKKFDVEFDVDPMFSKMGKVFDSGGASGMLLANLPLSRDLEVVFDSLEMVAQEEEDGGAVPAAGAAEPLPLDWRTIGGEEGEEGFIRRLVEEVRTYDIHGQRRGGGAGSGGVGAGPSSSSDVPLSSSATAPESAAEVGDYGAMSDDEANELEKSMMEDIRENPSDGPGELASSEQALSGTEAAAAMVAAPEQKTMGVETVLSYFDAGAPNDYSFFDMGRLGSWVGPSHWKFQPRSQQKGDGAAAEKEEKKSKRERGSISLDFTALPELSWAELCAPPKR